MKDYMGKKGGEKLTISLTEQKLTKSLASTPWSCSPDGLLHFGAKVMLHNKKTDGFLVLDTGDRLPTQDEAYAVTTNNKGIGPIARSVFVVTRPEEKDAYGDDVVHYGQKIRIQANPYIHPKTVTLLLIHHAIALFEEFTHYAHRLFSIFASSRVLHEHKTNV